MSTHTSPFLLIPGHWLGAWAWDDVQQHLTSWGHPVTALTLPGLDADDTARLTRTLDDQVAAIVRAAQAGGGPVIIVAHSGANAPVSRLLDQHPGLVRRVIWVDSGPAAPGIAPDADFPEDQAARPLPPFEVLGTQASLAGLGASALARFRERALSQPGTLLREAVTLNDDARFDVPTTFVCCSMTSAQVIGMAESGHPLFAEVAGLTDVRYVDLPTGHWPMWSAPRELAEILAAESAAS